MECDYHYGRNKNHTCKNVTKNGEPRDIGGNADEEEEEVLERLGCSAFFRCEPWEFQVMVQDKVFRFKMQFTAAHT